MKDLYTGAILGAVIAVSSQLLIHFAKELIKKKREYTLLKGELTDLERHCKANIRVLNAIDSKQGIPSVMHIKKLKIYEKSILFSEETYRTTFFRKLSHLYRFKTEIRNMNIEIDTLTAYLSENNAEKDTIRNYIEYIRKKTEYLLTRLDSLKNMKFIYPVYEDFSETPPIIIYDKKYPRKKDKPVS